MFFWGLVLFEDINVFGGLIHLHKMYGVHLDIKVSLINNKNHYLFFTNSSPVISKILFSVGPSTLNVNKKKHFSAQSYSCVGLAFCCFILHCFEMNR